MNVSFVEFEIKGDERGSLVAIEERSDAPFVIRRVYYIFGTLAGVRRGAHAHFTTRQMAVCVNGECRILLDDGRAQEEVLLDRPDLALMIEPMVWHEMYDFSPDSVLLVLADQAYDEADYIRSYEAYREELG